MKRAPRRQRLTELAVRKLEPEPRTFVVWDTHQRGLALRVQPTGRRSWYVVYSRRGRPRWLRLGDAGVVGLAAARELAAEILLAVARGKDPAAERRAERGSGSFEELAGRYVETYARKNNKSWAQADKLVRRYLLPRWGKLQAATIVRADVKAMMASIAAPVLANQVLAAASAIFSWALREEIVATSPCRGVDRNETRSRERILSDSEVPRFWSAFDSVGLVAGSALKTILLTGQRPGEISHMRHEHIRDGWWEMPGAPVPALGWPGTKNGETHRVWLPEAVREIIDELAPSPTGGEERGGGGESGFVFAGERGGAIKPLDAAMRNICSKLKVERATPHDLRRTHGSTITALGFGRDAMNRIQNHVEGGIADVYDQYRYAQENRHVMETVARRLTTLATGQTDEKVVPIR
jgi:integrase